jgi:hypothetical protein
MRATTTETNVVMLRVDADDDQTKDDEASTAAVANASSDSSATVAASGGRVAEGSADHGRSNGGSNVAPEPALPMIALPMIARELIFSELERHAYRRVGRLLGWSMDSGITSQVQQHLNRSGANQSGAHTGGAANEQEEEHAAHGEVVEGIVDPSDGSPMVHHYRCRTP